LLAVRSLALLIVAAFATACGSSSSSSGSSRATTSTAAESTTSNESSATASSSSSTSQLQVVKSVSASGEFASASVVVRVEDPQSIAVRVSAVPRQQIRIDWSTGCNRAATSTSRFGHFTTRGGQRALPLPMHDADECFTSPVGTLQGTGRVRVSVLVRSR
jgi:hypothetical protein